MLNFARESVHNEYSQEGKVTLVANSKNKRTAYSCSFCGKSQDQVQRLIAGPGSVYICDECIDVCREIIENEQATVGKPRLKMEGKEMDANPQSDDLHGIPMTEEAFERLISAENPYRYELIDGIVYDMTGSSPEHADIVGSIFSLIHAHIRKEPCNVYQNHYVAIPGKPPVVPDVVVTCDRADWDKDKRLKPFKIQSPRIVVEVLSPGTENYDRTEKFARYRCCSSLEVYILMSQDEPHVEVYRRIATGWTQELFSAGQAIKLDQIGRELPLDLIYEGVR